MRDETKNPNRVRSLATTLAIAFFTLSAVTLLANGSFALYTNILTYREGVANQQKLVAQSAGEAVSKFVQDKISIMQTAVDFGSPITATSDARNSFMDGVLGSHPSFQKVVLLNNQGRKLAETSGISGSLSSQFTANTNEAISQTSKGENYISPVYIDEATSEPLITIAVPVTNVFRDIEGALIAEVDLKFMWSLVDQLKVGETGYAYVVDNKGNLIAFDDTARVLAGENVKQISEVTEFIENPSSTTDITPEVATYRGLLGTTVLGTYIPLGTPEWAVVIELPTTEAYIPIFQAAAASVGSILLMAILAGVVGIVVARRIAVPLIELTNTATHIAGGDTQLLAKASGAQEITTLAAAFNSMTLQLRNLIGSLERRVAERTADLDTSRLLSERRAQELQSISEISRTISTEQKLEILLPLVTRLVSESLDFYHVGIFFVDEARQHAYLQATNSEGGQRMLARGHRLEVGTGLVGAVAETGRTRIALDVGSDASFFNNPDLPTTRSEMALPLNVRGSTIGVLDVQSIKPGAFTQADANTLGILADQVAIAIENARLFGQTQQAREEAEALYSQILSKEWNTFTKQETKVGYQQTATGGKHITEQVETEEIRKALDNGQVVVIEGKENKTQATIAVPVKLRGQTIGVLNIKAPTKTRLWSKEEVNLAQAISERLALALDNVRLLQESQRRAAKETKIGEVTAKIGASINMRNVLQTAVEELGRALPGSEVVIQFQSSQESNKNEK
jgi:GAF domain-containing protein/HAMP domain-containing protein